MAKKGTARGDTDGWFEAVLSLYRYVWKTSAGSQILLSAISVAVFLLELAPLEMQRRIVNTAVDRGSFSVIVFFCGLYLLVSFAEGGLKLFANVYRGSVIETACQRLRLDPNLKAIAGSGGKHAAEREGVAISIIASEVDAVGGFVGTSFSEPILDAGILVSVFGYMLIVQPSLALVAMALFIPQVFFIPVLQQAINRRTAERIRTVRALAVDIVDHEDSKTARREQTYRRRVADVYRLNMEIYRRKFSMTFLINLLYQFGVIGILLVGGWLLVHGRTEAGTVVAFISGVARTNDPWNDLVDFFRNLASAGIKYRLIEQVLEEEAEDEATRAPAGG